MKEETRTPIIVILSWELMLVSTAFKNRVTLFFFSIFFSTEKEASFEELCNFSLPNPKNAPHFLSLRFGNQFYYSTVFQTKPQWALLGDLGRRRLRHSQPYGNSTKQQSLLVGRQRRSFLLHIAAVAVGRYLPKNFPGHGVEVSVLCGDARSAKRSFWSSSAAMPLHAPPQALLLLLSLVCFIAQEASMQHMAWVKGFELTCMYSNLFLHM